jgi:hypothetical protein
MTQTTTIMAEMFEVLRQFLNSEYGALLPYRGEITRLDEYNPEKHPAPNLWFEKREKPNAKYIATITYADEKHSGCCSCLGETVHDAVKATIAKIGEHYGTKN